MHTGRVEPAIIRLWLLYSVVVRFRTRSGKLCTKVMNAILRKKMGTYYI